MIFPVLWMINQEIKATLISTFVEVDCLLCLCNIPMVLHAANIFGTISFCCFTTTGSFIITMLYRLLKVGIVCYRYVFVCRNFWVLSVQQRKTVVCVISGLTIFLYLGSFFYKDTYLLYSQCLGHSKQIPQFRV